MLLAVRVGDQRLLLVLLKQDNPIHLSICGKPWVLFLLEIGVCLGNWVRAFRLSTGGDLSSWQWVGHCHTIARLKRCAIVQ